MGALWVRNVIIRKAPCKRPPPSYLPRMDGERELFESGLFAYFLSLTVLNSTALNFVDFGVQIPFKIQSSNLQASYTSSLLSHVYNMCASSSPDSVTLDWDRDSKPCSGNPGRQDSWAHRQFSLTLLWSHGPSSDSHKGSNCWAETPLCSVAMCKRAACFPCGTGRGYPTIKDSSSKDACMAVSEIQGRQNETDCFLILHKEQKQWALLCILTKYGLSLLTNMM